MACVTTNAKILLRRDISANWSDPTKNPILASGEQGYETDTGKMKIGDGIHRWNDLNYFSGGGTGNTGATGPMGLSSWSYFIQNGGFTISDVSTFLGNTNNVNHLHSVEKVTTPCYASARVYSIPSLSMLFGLEDPLSSYYEWECKPDQTLNAVWSNTNGGSSQNCGTYTTSTALMVQYDGNNVYFLKDGIILKTITVPDFPSFQLAMYVDKIGEGFKNTVFGIGGSKGSTGATGPQGPVSAYGFDGGYPDTNYASGPIFDLGFVS